MGKFKLISWLYILLLSELIWAHRAFQHPIHSLDTTQRNNSNQLPTHSIHLVHAFYLQKYSSFSPLFLLLRSSSLRHDNKLIMNDGVFFSTFAFRYRQSANTVYPLFLARGGWCVSIRGKVETPTVLNSNFILNPDWLKRCKPMPG